MKNRKNAIIFLHIPKSAGSTFHMILNSRYKVSETFNVFGSRYSDPEIKSFINLPNEEKKGIHLLKGHMPYGLHNYMSAGARYITILRNPVERVVSQYYYIKKNTYNPLHEQVEHGKMSISDFVTSGIAIGMNNGQCRFLNGDIDEYEFNSSDESLLRSAIENIERHFAWVGITERFDESILVLSKMLGWKKPPYYIRENVSKIRKPRSELSEKDKKVIEEYNLFDIELYQYANKLLDREIKKVSSFDNDLDSFQKKNSRKQAHWGWLPDKLRRFVV